MCGNRKGQSIAMLSSGMRCLARSNSQKNGSSLELLRRGQDADLESLDVRRLEHGMTVDDSMNNANSATKWTCLTCGPGSEIRVGPEDLGVTAFGSLLWSRCCNKESENFDKMNA